MSESHPRDDAPVTGGCQCGATRYRLARAPRLAVLCHCRMCQRAFGSYAAPFGGVRTSSIAWTRGAPTFYRSSEAAERGFCAECGTPLIYARRGEEFTAIALGTLDDPERVRPAQAVGVESRLSFFHELASLPPTRTEDDVPADALERMRPLARPD